MMMNRKCMGGVWSLGRGVGLGMLRAIDPKRSKHGGILH
jgi:hypothetical protein